MAIGAGIIGVTLVIGDPNAKQGAIIGRLYSEAISTGMAQLARGGLEALVPFGWVANITLDVVATPFNLSKEIVGSFICEGCMSGSHVSPHKDIDYVYPFQFLHIV